MDSMGDNMSLDKLYEIIKDADFPINDRNEMMDVIGTEIILFKGKYFDAEEIAVHLRGYPFHSPSDVIKAFLEEEEEAFDKMNEGYLADFDDMMMES